jgi:PST family polysaccharide transporter
MDPLTETQPDELHLDAAVIRGRAARGAALLTGRRLVVSGFTFGGGIALARLLTPKDFGVVAIGFVVVSIAGALADGGLTDALVRSPLPVVRADLSAMLGLQLAATLLAAVVIAPTALFFGPRGQVLALLTLCMPAAILRAPLLVRLERRLEYRAIAFVDVVQTVAYYAVAISLAVAGAGFWSLAIAAVAQATLGSAGLIIAARSDWPSVSLDAGRIRPFLRLGLQFQAIRLIQLGRSQGFNAATGAVAGIRALGLWNVVGRILDVPLLVLGPAARTALPAFARLAQVGDDARRTLERIVSAVAVTHALMLVPVAAASPVLVPLVLGSRWSLAVHFVPGAALGRVILAPLRISATGYLFSAGRSRVVMRGLAAHIVAMAAVFAFYPLAGLWALGAAWLAGSAAESAVLLAALGREPGARLLGRLTRPAVAAVAGGAAGWAIAWNASSTVSAALLSVATATAVQLLVLALASRRPAAEAWSVACAFVRAQRGG